MAKKYRSGLEERLHEGPLKDLEHEPKWAEVKYIIPATYKPDFVHEDHPAILYEAKGRFRTFAEAKKYVHVVESNPELEIRFILSKRNSRAYPQTKMTMEKWLDKYNFLWCYADDVPEDWRT